MQTFLTVISFPFFFFGIIFMLGALFGEVTISQRPAVLPEKFFIFIIGAVITFIGCLMVS